MTKTLNINTKDIKDKIKIIDDIITTYSKSNSIVDTSKPRIRSQYSDYTSYLKYKNSDKLYNKGLYYKSVQENNNGASINSNKTLFKEVALAYFKDALILNHREPDYIYETYSIKI